MSKAVRFVALFVIAAQSASAEPVVVDANQHVIGSYLGPSTPQSLDAGVTGYIGMAIRVASTTGYLFAVIQSNGVIADHPILAAAREGEVSVDSVVSYSTTDCSGAGYVIVLPPSYEIAGSGGFVFSAKYSHTLFYSPKGSSPTTVVIRSDVVGLNGGQCRVLSEPSSPQSAYEVLPNDPNVTGVSQPAYPPPIVVGQVNSLRLMFVDGFESAS